MTYVGTPFDKMRVTPSLDARVSEKLSGTDVIPIWGLTVSSTGLNAVVNSGECVIMGRYVRITEQEPVNVPANWTGNICITIDLTKNNESSGNPVYDNYSVTNNQIYTRCVTDENLRKDDININGGVFDLVIATVVTDATAIKTIDSKNTPLALTPGIRDIRVLAEKNDRIYSKQAAFDVTAANKYRQLSIVLERQGSLVIAKIDLKTVTTLAWENLLSLSGFPGYRPDNNNYSGAIIDHSYNSEVGGIYVDNSVISLLHVGRTDVKECNYRGSVAYYTNDDFPSDEDIISGFKRI